MTARGGVTPPIWLLPTPPQRKRGLGRDEIIRAAVELADNGGADALTMRAVADRVGSSTPMSLYRYVHNRDGLVDLMLDAAMGEVEVPDGPGEAWRADVTQVARATWVMVNRHPWFAELVHSRPPAGPNAVRKQEFLLSVFDRLNVTLITARGYAQLIDGYVLGTALQHAEERKMWRRNDFHSVEEVRELASRWFSAERAAAEYPLTTRLMAGFLDGRGDQPPSVDEQFELGLACLLDGIAIRLGR